MGLQSIYDSLVTTRKISCLVNITSYQQMPFANPLMLDCWVYFSFLCLGQCRLFSQASLLALPLALFDASFWLESLALPTVLLVFWHMLLAFFCCLLLPGCFLAWHWLQLQCPWQLQLVLLRSACAPWPFWTTTAKGYSPHLSVGFFFSMSHPASPARLPLPRDNTHRDNTHTETTHTENTHTETTRTENTHTETTHTETTHTENTHTPRQHTQRTHTPRHRDHTHTETTHTETTHTETALALVL